MPGDLNIFQRAMLQWNALHPYNAVHVVRVAQRLELTRLRQVIENALIQRGVSHLTLDLRRRTYEFLPGSAPFGIRTVDAGGTGEAELSAQLEPELNTPFDINAPFCPFRFFVLAEQDGFFLGATYFHPVADAESMILLLRGIVATYQGAEDAYPSHPFDCHPARHDRLWRLQPGLLWRKLLALPASIRTLRHARRMRLRDADDLRNRVRLLPIERAALAALLDATKAWGVTVHDLLLALLLLALEPIAPHPKVGSRRKNLALGSIVNVRPQCGINRERTFGLFLGSFVVSHPVPAGTDLRALAIELSRETGRVKRGRLFLTTPLELAFAGLLFNLCSTRGRKQFYHKYHPLAGGISNMSLDTYWQREDRAKPAGYFRAVSTGPATPLVLSATTCNHGMTLAVSYRPAVFSPAEVDAVLARLGAAIHHLRAEG